MMYRWRRKIIRNLGRLLNAIFVLMAITVIFYLITEKGIDVTSFTTFTSSISGTNGTDLKIHYIDVGESDSVLIEQNHKFILIDAGDVDDKDTILNYLDKQKVKQLEYLILTHPHADHIGAAKDVIEHYQIKHVMMPKKAHTTRTYKRTIEAISKKEIEMIKPKVGDKIIFEDTTIQILAPNHYNYGSNINNYSITMKLMNGNNTFLFIGDCEKEAIKDILSNKINLKAEVYMCGHHGSSTSTTKALLDKVQPKYAVISVGENSYGHPSKEVVSMLKKKDIKLYRTDKDGTIVMHSDGKKIWVE